MMVAPPTGAMNKSRRFTLISHRNTRSWRAFGRGSREETFGRSPREDDRVIGRGARDGGRVIERDRVIGRSPREDGGFFGLSPRMNDW